MIATLLRAAFFLGILAIAPGIASAISLVRAPYIQNAGHDTMTIRWMTDTAVESHVDFGSAVGNLTATAGSIAKVVHHEVVLTGLSSDTRYFYQVSDEFGPLAGDDADHYFDTHPTPGANVPTRIWVVGDSGDCSNRPERCSIVQANKAAYLGFVGAQRANVMLLLGDNAYPSGTEEEYTLAFFDMFPDVLRNTPSWSAIGNHDLVTSNSYYEAFTHPTAGEAGGYPSGTEHFYSFDRGNVHFIALRYKWELTPGLDQYDWLEQDLLQNDANFTIVTIHVSPYSKGSHDSDVGGVGTSAFDLRATIIPLLEDHGVDLVLTGHSHGYERSVLIDGHYGLSPTCAAGQCFVDGSDGVPVAGEGGYTKAGTGPAPHQGTVYAVVGNGSMSWTDAQMGDHPVMATRVGEVGSLVVDINGLQLDGYMVDQFGAVRDHFRITKGASPVVGLGSQTLWLLAVSLAAVGLYASGTFRSSTRGTSYP
jgi:hypothetical protein